LRIAGQIACDIVLSFSAIAFVYIWWRPLWLRRLYLSAERKVSFLLGALAILGLVSLLLAAIAIVMRTV
jgi:hypothetical protein